MNKNIRELATFCIDNSYEFRLNIEDFERFAKLIIKECLSIVDDAERGGNNETWDNAVEFIRRDLKEHFGIEE
jgi:hypothetical protein